jgi:hypothetical protein
VSESSGSTLIHHRNGDLLFVRLRLIARVIKGSSVLQGRALDGTRLLIGSAPDADLALGDPLVSRRHCEIAVPWPIMCHERSRCATIEPT